MIDAALAGPLVDRYGKAYTLPEIADFLRLDYDSVRRLVSGPDAKLRAVKLPNGHYRVFERDLEEFLQECRGQDSKAPPTDSSSGDAPGRSDGRNPVVIAGAFRRGKANTTRRSSGGTNG